MKVFCGIDWAEDHHDVALVDVDGKLIGKRRISDDAAGFALLLQLFADAGDSAEEPIPVAIETGRGLLVACLRATGRTGVRDQPDGRLPLPGPALGGAEEVRRRRRAGARATSCAPTWPRTGRCRPIPNWPRRSPCSPAPSKTRSGNAPARTTSSARCCASTTRPSSPPSPTSATGCCARKPAPSWPPHPPPPPAAALTKPQLRAAAQTRRPTARPRGRSRPHPDRAARPATAPAADGRERLRPPGPRPAATARRGLHQRRGTRRRQRARILSGTRTPRSSPACQDSDLSPAPGYSPRSATTDPASPTRERSRPTPEPRPSPAPAAKA